MANQGLLRGWGAWHELWELKARQMRMLAAAVRRKSWLGSGLASLAQTLTLSIAQTLTRALTLLNP